MSHRILVVDDDAAILGSLKAFLQDQLGFEVHTAEEGKTAIESALSVNFDLCILDVNLPDLTGSEVYLRLRSINPDIQAVFYTGVNDFENSQDFLRFALPAERVLSKPANLRQLTQVIMGALGRPVLIFSSRNPFVSQVSGSIFRRGRPTFIPLPPQNPAHAVDAFRRPLYDNGFSIFSIKDCLHESDLCARMVRTAGARTHRG